MKKPYINERFADNGAHSHWELLDDEGGIIWTEDTENCFMDKHHPNHRPKQSTPAPKAVNTKGMTAYQLAGAIMDMKPDTPMRAEIIRERSESIIQFAEAYHDPQPTPPQRTGKYILGNLSIEYKCAKHGCDLEQTENFCYCPQCSKDVKYTFSKEEFSVTLHLLGD